MITVYHYATIDYHSVAWVYYYVVRIHCYAIFNVLHLVFLGNEESLTIASVVYMHHVLVPSLLIPLILPMQNNKELKDCLLVM